MIEQLFFELIRVAIGTQDTLSRPPSKGEWAELYAMAKKQSLVGICFAGLQKLYNSVNQEPSTQNPQPNSTQNQEPITQNLDEVQYLTWMGMAAKIQQRNEVVNEQCAILGERLKVNGYSYAALKGQGIAQLYNESIRGLRQSGDIDVWVKGGFEKVNEFVQRTAPTDDFAYHRFHYDAFPDSEVELHFRPTLMRNLFDNKKLQKWCDGVLPSEFVMTDLGFNVPPARFNRIFILTHIYRHFLFEGVGLRQVMDYYFVLKARNNDDVNDNDNLDSLLKEFRLTRFAGALMWVMEYVFAMDKKYMICEPDEKEGRFLLDEIMQTGNFGHGETRYNGFGTFKRMTIHGLHLLLHYPSEVIWTPVWLVYHKLWRMKYKRKTKR